MNRDRDGDRHQDRHRRSDSVSGQWIKIGLGVVDRDQDQNQRPLWVFRWPAKATFFSAECAFACLIAGTPVEIFSRLSAVCETFAEKCCLGE